MVTGILLAILYVPLGGSAWNQLHYMNGQASGRIIRGIHGWAPIMVAIVLIHRCRSFSSGAHAIPAADLIVGVFFADTLGMAFTGQISAGTRMPTGAGYGASISSRIPPIGAPLVKLLSEGRSSPGPRCPASSPAPRHSGPLIGSWSASLMVVKLGINDWPMPGRLVRRATYADEYKELTIGTAFRSSPVPRSISSSGVILLAIVFCALFRGLRSGRTP